jgi:hypothetical protein
MSLQVKIDNEAKLIAPAMQREFRMFMFQSTLGLTDAQIIEMPAGTMAHMFRWMIETVQNYQVPEEEDDEDELE